MSNGSPIKDTVDLSLSFCMQWCVGSAVQEWLSFFRPPTLAHSQWSTSTGRANLDFEWPGLMPINFPYVKLKSGFKITRGVPIGDTSPMSNSPTPEDKRQEPKHMSSKGENLINCDWLHNKHKNIHGAFVFNCWGLMMPHLHTYMYILGLSID